MEITFVEIARTGMIVLGKFLQGEAVLAYEARFPLDNGREGYVRGADLEKPARAYWEAIARDLAQAA